MNKKEAIKTIERDKIQVGRFTEITREVNAIQRKIKMADYVPLEIVVSVINKINEQQKLYTVEIPNPNLNAHTVLQKTEKGIVLVTVTNARWRGWKNSKLTESEIKQDFDFLWQFKKEVGNDTDQKKRYLDVIEKMEAKEETAIELLKQAKQTNLSEMFVGQEEL